jgi:hypothetical protein
MVYHQVCYVIKPQPSLLEFLESYKSASALSGSEVWVLGTGGYGAPLPNEHALGVKLFARIRSAVISQNMKNYEELLDKLMGQPPFHEAIFDRWWTLEKFGAPNDFEVVPSWISPDELSLVQASGSDKVNGWIATVEDRYVVANLSK